MAINSISRTNQYSNIFNQKSSQNNSVQNQIQNSTRKMEYQQRMNSAQNSSVVEQSMTYAQQLSSSRTKAKDQILTKKKCQYSFKRLSSQIIRSKTSSNARKAISAAKREIRRLKRLKGNEEYDQEELQLAIDHAKAMEKVAKKKVKHLEIEEMIERHGKGLVIDLEEVEKEEQSEEDTPDEEMEEEIPEEDMLRDEMLQDEILQEPVPLEHIEFEEIDYEALMESIDSVELEEISQESAEQMEELMSEMSDEMAEMMEELDITELAETMYAPDPDMSEDDLKMLKIKHRYKELKAIAEADKEYLKGIMENEKSKAESGSSMPSNSSASMPVSNEMPTVIPKIAMPGAAAGATMTAPTISGGFDVSV